MAEALSLRTLTGRFLGALALGAVAASPLPSAASTWVVGLQGAVGDSFLWTGLAGAAGYLFEFTLSPSGFALANAPAVELPANTILLLPGSFIDSGVTIELPLFIPATVLRGTRAQWRVFPVDAAGQVLSGATASDASTVVVQ